MPLLPSFLRPKGDLGHPARVFGEGRHKIVYETHGSGPPLLLVHGLSGSGRWWRHNVGPLSAQYTVHVIELVGYGGNRATRPMGIQDAAEALRDFIALLPEGKAHIIGHSMGGHIATILAAEFPARVNRLVLAAASGLVRSNVLQMALKLPVAGHYSPVDFLPTLAMDALRAGPLNLYLSTRDILRLDTSDFAPKIQADTLLIFGTRDNLVPVALGQTLNTLIPKSRLETLEGAGHVLMWDRAETFNRLVLAFLAKEI